LDKENEDVWHRRNIHIEVDEELRYLHIMFSYDPHLRKQANIEEVE